METTRKTINGFEVLELAKRSPIYNSVVNPVEVVPSLS
jgi:hypothetical protein